MPIYEYSCSNCGRTSEAIQRMSDPPLVHCPLCGSKGIEKLISAASIGMSERSPARPDPQLSEFANRARRTVDASAPLDFRGKVAYVEKEGK